jgi:hypothetical protein
MSHYRVQISPKTIPVLSQIIQIDRIPKVVYHISKHLLYESSSAFPLYIQNIVLYYPSIYSYVFLMT